MADTFDVIITELFTRLVAMEALALPESEAFPYPSEHSPEGGYPYWTNVLGGVLPQSGVSGGSDNFPYTVQVFAYLHQGWVIQDEGEAGETEIALMQSSIPKVIEYFNTNRNLVYETGQRKISFMRGDLLPVQAQGIQEWVLAPARNIWGARFTFTVPFFLNFAKC